MLNSMPGRFGIIISLCDQWKLSIWVIERDKIYKGLFYIENTYKINKN